MTDQAAGAEPAAPTAAGPRPLLVFDGDCGFCTKSVQVIERHIQPDVTFEPWQTLDLQTLRLTTDQVTRSVQFLPDPDGLGRRRSGAQAVAELLRRSPRRLWRPLGYFLRLAPVSWVAALLYRLVAANRHRLPGGTPACALPPAR